LPRLVKTPGASGAELTALNLDKTAALEEAASQTGDPSGKALLGELQFAYITFLFGQSLEGARSIGAVAQGLCVRAAALL
jgi:A1 cistron-splicing factor AAR2